MLRRIAGTVCTLSIVLTTACFEFNVDTGQADPDVGMGITLPAAFVVSGTMVEGESFRPCPVFEATNGIQYHLFPSESLSLAELQAVTTIGAQSVLEAVIHRELDLRCQADDLREVLEVIAVLDVQSP